MNNKNLDIQLFPYALMRIAGEPFDTLCNLRLGSGAKLINEINNKKISCDTLKLNICDNIYSLISNTSDNKLQNLLLNFKRNIFNERDILTEAFERAKEYLNKQLINDIIRLQNIKKDIEIVKSSFDAAYNSEMFLLRSNFQKAVNNEKLLKGLLISSQSLLKRTESYLKRNVKDLNKDDIRTELSLTKYLSRMCAKTSPFSTFTNLSISEYSDFKINGNCQDFIEYDEFSFDKITSHIRVNNYLFQYLKGLLYKNIKIYRWFLLRVNPTLEINTENFIFLTNFNNIESFQRIPLNPVIEVIIYILKQKEKGINLDELISIILSNEYIDAKNEELEKYIVPLIEYGLIEFNLEVSGLDPDWDEKLVKTLHVLAGKHILIDELIDCLKHLRKLSDEYSTAGTTERGSILVEAHKLFKNTCMKLHEDAGLPENERKSIEELLKFKKRESEENEAAKVEESKTENKEKEEDFKFQSNTFFYFKPEQMFYEDSSLDNTVHLDFSSISNLVVIYHGLLQQLKIFDTNSEEMQKMLYFFLKKYESKGEINILRFYEDFYRDFKKPEAEFLENTKKQKMDNVHDPDKAEKKVHYEKNVINVPTIEKRRKKINEWLDHFYSNIKLSEIINEAKININQTSIPAENDVTNGEHSKILSSYGVFIQLFSQKDEYGNYKVKGVINATLTGFSKFLSRFLHLFDDNLTKEVRIWNEQQCNGDIFAEDCDNSHFNANIHPSLMPFEIWMPGSQNNLSVDKQIPITDLNVVYDKTTQQLKLLHKTQQKYVYIFDLGFQGIMGRSHLFQILQRFSKTESLFALPILNFINESKLKSIGANSSKEIKDIFIRPRITYEDSIILQRKAWLVPKSKIPLKISKESDSNYFLKLNVWRMENIIPDEVFIYIMTFRGVDPDMKPEEAKKLTKDDYKPQYIDFRNPFLVNLFCKLAEKTPYTMRIEEMLPRSEDLAKFNNKKFVTEFLIQWYNN